MVGIKRALPFGGTACQHSQTLGGSVDKSVFLGTKLQSVVSLPSQEGGCCRYPVNYMYVVLSTWTERKKRELYIQRQGLVMWDGGSFHQGAGRMHQERKSQY